ncbi:hypothetical protein ACFLTH_17615, partial [Bacteroidota bacterium]
MEQRKTSGKQQKLKGLVLILLAMLLSSLVSGEISITSVSAPSTVTEGDLVQVSFAANTDENESINYKILIDGEEVSTTNSYQWQTNYTNSGTYEFIFIASTTNSSVNQTKTVIVANNPLDLDITSPTSTVYSNTTMSVVVESEQADSCNYDLNSSETGILVKSGTTFTKILSVSEGSHELIVNCTDSSDSDSDSVVFTIDRTAPQITDSGPNNPFTSPIQGSSARLAVDTDEIATCKYDTFDEIYDSMSNIFSSTDSTNHYSDITGLADGGHIYYVRCKDALGNKMSLSEQINFYTNKKPTAKIDLDKNPPLKEGRYEVDVTTSEDLASEPTLQYNFQDDSTIKTISLTGSGKSWSGYLIIDESTDNSVGAFHFSGTDLSGLSGNEITSGKLFLVDTTEPLAVASFEIEQKGNRLRLEWYHDGEDTKRFKIYRSLESGVTYTDFYKTTTQTFFEDTNVNEGVTYYYKVIAEDDAENEGPLSDQKSGRIEPELKESAGLSPYL